MKKNTICKLITCTTLLVSVSLASFYAGKEHAKAIEVTSLENECEVVDFIELVHTNEKLNIEVKTMVVDDNQESVLVGQNELEKDDLEEEYTEAKTNEYETKQATLYDDTIMVYDKPLTNVSNKIDERFKTPSKIRCTFYVDHGYTKSQTYTKPGVLAGKKEWLGMACNLYAINEDGSIGDFLGTYHFLDTGAGINGDSLKKGESIDMWFSTYSEGDAFREKYGDYVYMEIIEMQG